jgi:hypothetical protein
MIIAYLLLDAIGLIEKGESSRGGILIRLEFVDFGWILRRRGYAHVLDAALEPSFERRNPHLAFPTAHHLRS